MDEPLAYFITWTTYGTWLPGDRRGWRKLGVGEQLQNPSLEQWCRERLTSDPVILTTEQRRKVEAVCHHHADTRGWFLHAVSARSNHIHLAVTADAEPRRIRDQFKANATRVLRDAPNAIAKGKIWTRGGDIEFVGDEAQLDRIIIYITEAQDRMGRGK